MNDSPRNDTEAIRSDIDVTRRRMDDTMDALGDRLQPRHLLDELLGFLRGNSSDGETRMTHLREKITHSCDTAMHSVVDTVKKNPMPALAIGAGVAWLIYSSRRDRSGGYEIERYSAEDAAMRYDPDTHFDRPLEYPPASEYPTTTGSESAWSEQGESKLGAIKDKLSDKASSATQRVKETLSHAGEAAREKMGALQNRAGEVTARVRDTTREAYTRTRERVSTTADHHPLEVGLVALAAGLIAGLAMPTPNVVNRRLGPTADRLRDRTREAGSEMLEKGKRVAEAAATAVKEEAQAQGLTPEGLRDKAAAVADRAREAGKQTAEREGLAPTSSTGTDTNASYPPGSDPTVARPAV
jgi:ElaB/YqjD/DUF883 family membrane-anchored ribosome-binding protein